MARKRGGLAGLYDRNKGMIRTASTIGASLLGGPGAGAAVGAAFRGLDRPGKRGIGFDVGQGLRGGVEGYGVGKLTKAGQAGLGKLFAPKAAASAAPGMTRTAMGAGMDIPGLRVTAPEIGALAKPAAERGLLESAASAVGSGVGRAAKTIQEYPKAAEMILGALPSPETDIRERQAAVQEGELALQRQQFDEMMRRQRMQEEREALIAQLFSPILQRRLAESNSTTMARG